MLPCMTSEALSFTVMYLSSCLPPPEEIHDLENQLSKGGLSAHELEKAKKKLELDKVELTESLEVGQR